MCHPYYIILKLRGITSMENTKKNLSKMDTNLEWSDYSMNKTKEYVFLNASKNVG
jgi:hypothetical protein